MENGPEINTNKATSSRLIIRMRDKIVIIRVTKKSFENNAKFKYLESQHHSKLTLTINSHSSRPKM